MRLLAFLLWIILFTAASVANVAAQDTDVSESETKADDLEAELSYRIIGGVPAARNAWPWQVALFKRAANGSFMFQCGGSVVDRRWILTAAHCVYDESRRAFFHPQELIILEGTTRIENILNQNRAGRRLNIAQVIGHEKYLGASDAYKNDIALLQLTNSANSQPVTLALPENNALETPDQAVTVTGWGLIKAFNKDWQDFKTGEKIQSGDPRYFTNRLMEVTLSLLDCQRVRAGSNIDHSQVCAGVPEGGKDSCRGDSGGPLVGKNSEGTFEQIGVVSYGWLECGVKGASGVYSKVSAFESWLKSRTGADFKKPEKPVVPPSVKPPVTQPPAKPTANNKAGLSVGFVQGNTLKPGQTVQFSAVAAAPGYLVLIDVTPDGKATQIYPNKRSLSASTLSRSNRLEAGRQLVVPDPNNPYGGFEFKVDPPTGEGFLLAILSAKPLTSIDLSSLPKTMERVESMEYLSGIVGELKRDLSLSPGASAQEWSYVISPYRIVQ